MRFIRSLFLLWLRNPTSGDFVEKLRITGAERSEANDFYRPTAMSFQLVLGNKYSGGDMSVCLENNDMQAGTPQVSQSAASARIRPACWCRRSDPDVSSSSSDKGVRRVALLISYTVTTSMKVPSPRFQVHAKYRSDLIPPK